VAHERPGSLSRTGAVVAAGVLLWLIGTYSRSLWIDEFHSLFHARAPDLLTFFASVRMDNHPPLSFLLIRWSTQVFGETPLALRLPAMLAGVLYLVVLVRLARRLPDAGARRLLPWLGVLSTLCFTIFCEARMYGWLALAVLGSVEAILAGFDGRRSRWWLALWVGLGLHSHYYFLHYGLVLSALVACVAALDRSRREAARSLFAPALLGLVVSMPWIVWGLVAQLEHGMPAGSNYSSVADFVQSLGHLFFMGMSYVGSWLTYGVALPGTAAVAVAAVLGVGALWRAHEGRDRLLMLFLVGGAALAPAWAWLASLTSERVSYNWRYVAGSTGPALALVAIGLSVGSDRTRAALRVLVVGTMLVVTVFVALSPGQENWRGVVRLILERAEPGDAVLVKPLWDLDHEHSPTGYDYYAPRLAGDDPFPPEIRTRDWRLALEHERVWVIECGYYPKPVIIELRAAFAQENLTNVGGALIVHLFHDKVEQGGR